MVREMSIGMDMQWLHAACLTASSSKDDTPPPKGRQPDMSRVTPPEVNKSSEALLAAHKPREVLLAANKPRELLPELHAACETTLELKQSGEMQLGASSGMEGHHASQPLPDHVLEAMIE